MLQEKTDRAQKPTIDSAGTGKKWALEQAEEALDRLRFGEIIIRVYKGEATLVKVQEEFQRP